MTYENIGLKKSPPRQQGRALFGSALFSREAFVDGKVFGARNYALVLMHSRPECFLRRFLCMLIGTLGPALFAVMLS